MTSSTAPRATSAGRTRMLTTITAPLAGALVWILAVPVAGVDLVARPGGPQAPAMVISVASVLVAALLVALLGWALLALLERFAPRPRLLWTVLAVVVLTGSLVSPLTAADGAASVVLVALHLVVGGVVLAGMLARPPRSSAHGGTGHDAQWRASA